MSLDTRKIIINFHAKKGKSYAQIASLLDIKKSTIAKTVQRWKNEGRVASAEKTGRPSKLSIRMRRILKRIIDKDPELSIRKIVTILQERHGITISYESVRTAIHKYGYKSCSRRKKPHISKKNRVDRVNFAKKYLDEPPEFWEKVLFTDESKFNIFGWDGRIRVWRKPQDGLNPKYTAKTVKHNGGGVMVWGCMAANGVGNLHLINGIMDQYVYIDILKKNLRSSTDKLGITRDYYFQQDNDPKHTSLNARLFLTYNTPHMIKSPAQSPDLNPIEHLWDVLERRLRMHVVRSRTHFQELLMSEWGNILPEITRNLVMSMPNRLREVIRNKGYATRY